MAKPKKKRPKTKKEIVAQIIGIFLLLVFLGFIFIYTDPGCDVLQGMVNKNPKKSWTPGLQWRIARIHNFMGRSFYAAKAFERYYLNYPKANVDRTIEAEYMELSCLKDSEQYETCEQKVEDFLDKYANDQRSSITTWYAKADAIKKNLDMMPISKKYDHSVY
jgi:hypothetical protein